MKLAFPGRKAHEDPLFQRKPGLDGFGYCRPLMGQIPDFSIFNASLSPFSFQMIVSVNNNQFREQS